MDQVILKARAKINLALDVLRKRPDGYHELRSIMQSLTLYDSVAIKKVSKDNYLKLVANVPFLPTDAKNIAYKAARMIMERCKIEDGIFISLDKQIPVSAGLGGGSADCAAVLVGFKSLFRLPLPQADLYRIGIGLGADVPFCLMRGTALAEGAGERLTRLRPLPNAWILLAKPPIVVSTAEIFGAYNPAAVTLRPDIEKMMFGIYKADLKIICKQMVNVLESVTIKLHPVIGELKEFMLGNGALGALMSGSGPTVFGVFETQENAAATLYALKDTFPHVKDVFITRFFNSY